MPLAYKELLTSPGKVNAQRCQEIRPFALMTLLTAAQDQILYIEHTEAKWSSVCHAGWVSISAMHIKAGCAIATGE